ncbi:MAG: Gfo/Idh/MocA family oxidoreductase [Deltaproteobacteria bacterium]|nr:Gfo/Idh/MocA family oxidoreductase [Deltaproteobacteria bacterium]
MAEPVSVTLIGCGTWGRNLLRVLTSEPAAEVASVIDSDPRALQVARSLAPRARLEGSVTALRTAPTRAVLIATPGPLHATHALIAIECGAHVFVEKPLATAVADAARVADAAATRGVLGMVGHVLRYHPAVQSMIELVRSGALGRPLHMVSKRCSVAGSRDVDGSVLWSLAPHDLSVLLAIDSSPIRRLRAEGRRNGTTATLELETALGLRANLLVSRAGDRKVRRIEIQCERGRVEFDDTAACDKLSVQRDDDRVVRHPSLESAEPLREEVRAFLRAVRDCTPPPTGLSEGLAVVTLLAQAGAVIESSLSSPPPVFAER